LLDENRSFGFNYWLEEGELPDEEYDGVWGENDQDYDEERGRTW